MTDKERETRLIRPLRGGQITIPADFRRSLGIGEGTVLQATLRDGELRLKPLRVAETAQGSPWLRELYEQFAPAREEALERRYTEAEIDTAIDAAVRAVRDKR